MKGKISSANSRANKTLLPYKDLSAKPAMGAQATSVTSPRIGTSSDDVPIVSITRHKSNLLKSGETLLVCLDSFEEQ